MAKKETKPSKKADKAGKEVKKSKKTEVAVKAKAKAKEAGKKKAEGKNLSPLEKARLARAANKDGKGKAKAKKKNALPIFKAPDDFKPYFATILFKTEKDGLLGNAIKMTRFQGRYDPEADEKKKFDMMSYDSKTVLGVLARFSMTTFATNAAKRLPANAVFHALIRVNKKAADGSLAVGFKGLSQVVKNDKGRVKLSEFDKKDPIYRKFRKASRILPAAFKDTVLPPKRSRGKNVKEADDE